MVERLDEEMVATYAVGITGIQRSKSEMAKLDNAIRSLRQANYSPSSPVSLARFGTSKGDRLAGKRPGGKEDIFVGSIDQLEGRIQTAVSTAMASGMAQGKRVQAATLRAATTKTGRSGKPAGRKGPGREVTGEMIGAIATNVETQKVAAVTSIVGWHGWARHRPTYYEYQEGGTKGRKSGQLGSALKRKVKTRDPESAPGLGVPAANSLGAAIIVVREHLKRELGKLKR
jgi:hypothetical protein